MGQSNKINSSPVQGSVSLKLILLGFLSCLSFPGSGSMPSQEEGLSLMPPFRHVNRGTQPLPKQKKGIKEESKNQRTIAPLNSQTHVQWLLSLTSTGFQFLCTTSVTTQLSWSGSLVWHIPGSFSSPLTILASGLACSPH